MTNWTFTIKIKNLMTENEDWESVQKSMTAIAEVLYKHPSFRSFGNLKKFKKIPKGNDILGSIDYANKLINEMYDFADANRIWIE